MTEEAGKPEDFSLSQARQLLVVCRMALGWFAEVLREDWQTNSTHEPMGAGCSLWDALGPVVALCQPASWLSVLLGRPLGFPHGSMLKLQGRLRILTEGKMLESFDEAERSWERRGYETPFLPRGEWRDGELFQGLQTLLAECEAEVTALHFAVAAAPTTASSTKSGPPQQESVQAGQSSPDDADEDLPWQTRAIFLLANTDDTVKAIAEKIGKTRQRFYEDPMVKRALDARKTLRAGREPPSGSRDSRGNVDAVDGS